VREPSPVLFAGFTWPVYSGCEDVPGKVTDETRVSVGSLEMHPLLFICIEIPIMSKVVISHKKTILKLKSYLAVKLHVQNIELLI